jgi:hypothetical protein
MSRVRADRYTNRAGTGSPTFSEGVNVVGISSLGITTVTGVGQTALTVNGDARITGVLTVGQGSVTIGSTNITTQYINDIQYPTAGPLSNRNLVINGAMQVAQRGTQVTGVTDTNFTTTDRFKQEINSLGTWTIDQSTDAPDDFTYSFKLTCTTANASPAASAYSYVGYKVEAQDLQQLNYGSSAAKAMTLSFWVKSNKTGNATVAVLQRDNSIKLLSPQYSISSADTWEYKTISIPGDTAGVINNDNGSGLEFEFYFNAGSTYTTGSHQTTWSTYNNANRCPSSLGVGGATSDYFAITGVQLEVGERSTPFEHRSYGDELAKCMRYYEQITTNDNHRPLANFYSTTAANFYVPFKVIKRAAPTIAIPHLGEVYTFGWKTITSASATPSGSTGDLEGCSFSIVASSASSSEGYGGFVRNQTITINSEI